MAYYSIFPEKDTTLYSHPDRIHMNTGKDEILELVEEKSSLGNIYYTSRILIKFKNEEIKDTITSKINKEINTSNCEVSLELFTSEHKNLNKDQIIEAYPLSESMSWEEGAQRYNGNPPSITTGSLQAANGATWVYRNESTGSAWPTGSFATGVTGSYTKQKGGGAWYIGTNFKAENTFFSAADDLDLNLDVTTIVQKFSASYYQSAIYPTGIPNNGFIIKKPSNEEQDNFGYGALQYFSTDTHTIYSPKLTFKWDDSSYSHNGTTLTSGDIFLSLYNSKQEYQRKSKQRFRLTTRKRYPDRAFVTSSNYLDIQYLPTSSYYSVRDAETNEVIIPFDTNYTKLSADSEGMYFDLHMEGFQPERYYKLMFRVDNSDGINIHDEDYSFKIVR
jgi:hypothetical protein